ISLVQASLYSPVRVYLVVVTAALCRTRADPDLLRPHQSASGRSPTLAGERRSGRGPVSRSATNTSMRLSAIALFVGGLLQVPATAFDPDLYDPRALFNPAEKPAHAVFWIAYLLITMGLPAAYFIHIGKFGWLGTVGLLL